MNPLSSSAEINDSLLMSSGPDANHLMPEDESCFHHLSITASSVQVSLPTRKCDVMIPKAERKRWACLPDLNLLITFSRNLVG